MPGFSQIRLPVVRYLVDVGLHYRFDVQKM